MSGYISLTKKCPCRCLNCPLVDKDARTQPDLTLDEIKRTVEVGVAKGMNSIVLSGGEPTSHPDIIEIVRVLSQYPVIISFLTTCVAFANDRFMERLLGAAPASRMRIATAIHSYNPDLHDYMTSCKGSLKRALKGIDNAVKAGIFTTVKHLITRPTYRDLPVFVQKSYEVLPENMPLLLYNIDYCGVAYKQREIIQVSFRESEPYLSAALDYVISRSDSKRQVSVMDTPHCALGSKYWSFLRSLAKTTIPIYSDPATKGRKHKENLVHLSGPHFPPCELCSQREECPGSWPSVWNVFGAEAFRSL